jgi:hypothetical protein
MLLHYKAQFSVLYDDAIVFYSVNHIIIVIIIMCLSRNHIIIVIIMCLSRSWAT